MQLTIKYPLHAKHPTVHACEIMDHFGIGFEQGEHVVADDVDVPIQERDIVSFTGPSGSGKSSLLRAAAAQLNGVVDMHSLELPEKILVDGIGLPLAETLELLSACGLSEAQLMLRTPHELSDGQRYRYRLALAIARGAKWILADEFTASLDRVLAKTIAYNVGRIAAKRGCGFLIATTHDDILADLQPTLHVRCRLDAEPAVIRREREPNRISFAENLSICAGKKSDWPIFARWHYRGKGLGYVRKVFLLHFGNENVGICLFATPCASLRARNRYFGIHSRRQNLHLRALNAQVATLARVVLHPTYRGIGVAAAFVRRCCELMPYPWIETLTEMGHINPFFEKAGFTRVGVCEHADRTLAEHSAIYGGKSKTH
ncbi:MAG: hypothetical protein WEB58_21505, partial [Planctomycetaceae bacterium]